MPKRAYDGSPLDGTMKHIAERNLEAEAEKLEVPDEDSPEGDETTEFTAGGLLTKKQKVAKISAETGITDYEDLYEHIRSNYGFTVAKSYVWQIVEGDAEVEGFEMDGGEPTFDNPVADIKQAIIRKARLNPELSHAEIQESVNSDKGIDLKYSWVRRVIHRHADWEQEQKGHKKEAIIEAFEDTGLKSQQLADEVERRTGITVTPTYVRQLAERGELEGYYEIEQDPTKKEWIEQLAEKHNTTDTDEVYQLIKSETDVETKRAYVREVLWESKKSNSDNCESSSEPPTQEEVYSRSEIEEEVLKPVVSAKQSADEKELRCLEEFERLVTSMLNKGGENER